MDRLPCSSQSNCSHARAQSIEQASTVQPKIRAQNKDAGLSSSAFFAFSIDSKHTAAIPRIR
eukprot:1162029-Pelagomonas_calceolata.AAC.3